MAIDRERLHRVLNPQTVVVVGDKPPFTWLLPQGEYQGQLYSVQVDPGLAEQIVRLGVPNASSLREVPFDHIDLVICAVPRRVAPLILEDAIAVGASGIHFFTAGFAEVGDEEGLALQQRLAARVRESGIVMIGPNCMGIYNRRMGLKFHPDMKRGDGRGVSFIGQSGTHSMNLTLMAEAAGLNVARAISIGNAVTTTETDVLDYLRDDPETEAIGMYLEGVRDGRRFLNALRATVPTKPVVVWRGGISAAGKRATLSHTASLAGANEVWDAVMRQTGATAVRSVDETIDVLQALVRGGRPAGPRVALLAMTGGQSVAITDAFSSAGLQVPPLSDSSYSLLADVVNVIGGSYRNPLDLANTIALDGGGEKLVKILGILAEDDGVDGAVFEFSASFFLKAWQAQPQLLTDMLDALDAFRETSSLPLITVLHPYHEEAAVRPVREHLTRRGYAVYPSFERAAVAYAKLVDYATFR